MPDISKWNIHGTQYDVADAAAREDIEDLQDAVDEKLDTPATAGTAGQVLGLDSNLSPVWMNQSGGSDLPSGGSTGDVLIKSVSGADWSSRLTDIENSVVADDSMQLFWEQGSILTANGENDDSTQRVRTPSYYVYIAPVTFHVPSGLKLSYRLYDATGTYISSSDWYTDDFTLQFEFEQRYRIVAAYTASGQQITPSDASVFTADTKKSKIDVLKGPYRNIFDGNVSNLAFSSGKIVAATTYRSFFWEVKNGETYTVTRASTSVCNRFRIGLTLEYPVAGVDLYKPDGTKGIPDTSGDSATIQTISVPSNNDYKYAVVYLSNASETIDDTCQLMIVKGGVAQPWEKYQETAVDKKLRDDIDEITSETIIKLQQMNRPNRWPSSSLNTPPLVLLHFSDIHDDSCNIGRIAAYYNKYAAYMDDAIHTGDIVANTFTEGIDLFDSFPNALQVIGNHDTKVGSDTYATSESDSYTNYFAPYVSGWNATTTTGKCYYYKDYASKNVRLIVLDNMHESAEQLSWFADALAGAKTNGYTVVCACHIPYQGLTSLETQFDSEILTNYYDTQLTPIVSGDYPSAVDTFITGGGKFACWLVGHTHFNIFAKLTNHSNQLVVAVPNAGITHANCSDADRKAGTKSQDCFNIVAIDDYSSLVKVMRVGCNYTRWMKHPEMVCWDFANNKFRN